MRHIVNATYMSLDGVVQHPELHGLLDELHIWLHPLLVGNTDPRDHIGAVGAASRWQLDDMRRHDSGLVILSYRQLL